MNLKFVIKGELPTLNEYIGAERASKFYAAKMKKEATERVFWEIKAQTKHLTADKIFLTIIYYCKNKRKDKDNIAFGKKFIFDGLQKSGVIPNDGWDNVEGWVEDFKLDKDNPRIEVSVVSSHEPKGGTDEMQ